MLFLIILKEPFNPVPTVDNFISPGELLAIRVNPLMTDIYTVACVWYPPESSLLTFRADWISKERFSPLKLAALQVIVRCWTAWSPCKCTAAWWVMQVSLCFVISVALKNCIKKWVWKKKKPLYHPYQFVHKRWSLYRIDAITVPVFKKGKLF